MRYSISGDDIRAYNATAAKEFPKYSTQIMNLANQNAGGTRPRIVGQLSELFPQFLDSCTDVSVERWEEWYCSRYPEAMEIASDKIYEQINNLRSVLPLISKEMVENWVKDLVITKTYNGLYVQRAILSSLAKRLNAEYRIATKEEEAKGIDGYVAGVPYSIKPDTYKVMDRLPEQITVRMIYYSKTSSGGLALNVEEQ